MKKLLLTLAIVALGVSSMNADEITINTTNATIWTQEGDNYTTEGGFKVTIAKANSSNPLVAPDADAARIYQGATLTVAAPDGAKMTKVAMTEVYTKATDLTHAEFSEGWTAYGKLTSSKLAEEFGAESAEGLGEMVMTAGKQIRISQIVVTYTPAAGGLESAGLKYETAAYTAVLGEEFTAPELTNPNNLDVTYSSSDEAVATVAVDGAVTIKGVGETTITATSAKTDKYYEGKASYTLVVVNKYNSVAEFYTVGKDGNGLIGFDLTVVYANGANNYATTGTEWTLVYGYKLGLKAGDVIPAGWQGTYSPYNGLPEIKPIGNLPETTTGEAVKIEEVEAVDLTMINKVVVLNGVKFDAETPASGNFEGKIGETTVPFRNQFKVEATAAGTYDVTCAVGYFESDATEPTDAAKIQVYPISYKAAGEAGIDEIGAVENAPVEYFNLQGIRVANPDNGIYIRRQGSKVTKVLVK